MNNFFSLFTSIKNLFFEEQYYESCTFDQDYIDEDFHRNQFLFHDYKDYTICSKGNKNEQLLEGELNDKTRIQNRKNAFLIYFDGIKDIREMMGREWPFKRNFQLKRVCQKGQVVDLFFIEQKNEEENKKLFKSLREKKDDFRNKVPYLFFFQEILKKSKKQKSFKYEEIIYNIYNVKNFSYDDFLDKELPKINKEQTNNFFLKKDFLWTRFFVFLFVLCFFYIKYIQK